MSLQIDDLQGLFISHGFKQPYKLKPIRMNSEINPAPQHSMYDYS